MMKVLLMGDASNYHATLAKGLARLGCEVTVASNGSRWMDTARDIDISRRPGRIGGALLWVRLSTVLASRLKGYDVVQLSNPVFTELKPHRVMQVFRRLKRDNGSVFLTALGTDTAFVDMCTSPDNPLRYSEWGIGGCPTPYLTSKRGQRYLDWLRNPLRDHCQHIYDNVDGVVTALYEYHRAMERRVDSGRLVYGGLPVQVDDIPFVGVARHTGPARILVPYHPGRELEKGIPELYEAATRVPGAVVEKVTGLRFDDFVTRLSHSEVVVDQLYSYTPATTALLAMAMGKTVVTGAEPDYEAFIGDKVPAINPVPGQVDRLTADITAALDADAMAVRASQAREFVRRHHDAVVVARRFVEFWKKRMP